MREPELIFAEDGSVVSWLAQDGMLLVGISDATESHEHRLVLAPRDLGLMLQRVIASHPGPLSDFAHNLHSQLYGWLRHVDAQTADQS